MFKREVVPGRIYKAGRDGSCVNCGKEDKKWDSALEDTYIFEHCSLKAILRQIKKHFKGGYYEGGTAKITIAITKQQTRRD